MLDNKILLLERYDKRRAHIQQEFKECRLQPLGSNNSKELFSIFNLSFASDLSRQL